MTNSHHFSRVDSGTDEEPSRSQVLTGVPDHHVSFLVALKRVVDGELAAGHVETTGRVKVVVPQSHLGTQM